MQKLFILFYFLIKYSIQQTLNSTYIYSQPFKTDYSGSYFKYYIIDNTNGTNTDMLYIEFVFNEVAGYFNQFSNFKLNAYWFTNLTYDGIDQNSNGFFIGVGQTKTINNSNFNDMVICKSFLSLQRCDDYFFSTNNTNNLEDLTNYFVPNNDIGKENILSYSFDGIITSGIYPFTTLFKTAITFPSYSKDYTSDLQLDFKNNITIVIGEVYVKMDNNSNTNVYNYNVLRAATKNLTNIILAGKNIKISYILMFITICLNLIFYIYLSISFC